MQTLLDIEEIKQLKARYFRGIDTCNLELLKTVLADAVHIRFDSPTYQYEINGIDEAMNFYRNAFTHRRFGIHHGHTRLCCTSRKADEITPAPDAAMPWHPRAPCSGARVA
ncbi:nuclear transport factor 2 family protein [Comamonas thiooxydans]|uniref:nuclear transport factor 2 family protein n=1 Tax=Comamonas thiooxydans TaxID=363952 RepID=UPI003D090E91